MSAGDPLALARHDLVRGDAYIGVAWRSAPTRFAVRDPADDAIIAEVADCGATLAAAAVDAAHGALPRWRVTPVTERARLLRAWAELMVRHREDLARLISREQGKPLAESRGEVDYGVSYLLWFADLAPSMRGDVIASPDGRRRMFALREPVGVVAAITPWNFPLAMLARKLAPALAAGCTAVAKPAEDTPLTALAIAALAEEAGIPAGVINIAPCARERAPELVQVWIEDARVRKLSFTGSTAVGRTLARAAGGELKRLSLELGGDAPFLVFADCDLERAVTDVMFAKFRNAGQACIAANRIYVEAAAYDAFCERFVAAASRLRVGAAGEGEVEIGPLINSRAAAQHERLIDQSRSAGAHTLLGGQAHARGGNFVTPTVFAHSSESLAKCRGEMFAPIASLVRFETEAEAVAAANDTPFGLAAYVHSRDDARAWRLAHALECGMVGLNEAAISSAAAPFGGVKQSGYGREGAHQGLEEFQALKYVCMGGVA